MLCLTRKLGQRVLIGDNIVVTVVENSRGRVVLGIDAPRDVAVDREEMRADREAAPAVPAGYRYVAPGGA